MRVSPSSSLDHIRQVLTGAISIIIGMSILIIAGFILYVTFNLVRLGIIWLSTHWFC